MLLKYSHFYLKCTVHSLVCAKVSLLSRSRHFSQTELSGQWVWLTACSASLRGWDPLYPSLGARAKAGWKWHPGGVSLWATHWCLTQAICLHSLSVIDGTGGDSSVTSGPSPHLCQCCFTVTFICLNENQQISITLQMYKQLQYCGHYSINMNVLLALSIPMLFHALLACSDPGRTLWLHWVQRVEFCW